MTEQEVHLCKDCKHCIGFSTSPHCLANPTSEDPLVGTKPQEYEFCSIIRKYRLNNKPQCPKFIPGKINGFKNFWFKLTL